jgi:hypothetical protein
MLSAVIYKLEQVLGYADSRPVSVGPARFVHVSMCRPFLRLYHFVRWVCLATIVHLSSSLRL